MLYQLGGGCNDGRRDEAKKKGIQDIRMRNFQSFREYRLERCRKVLAGVTRLPRYETLIALERVLKKQTDRIDEALPETSEKRQGDYTVEDYYLIPKERRVELIDGVIYDMASPTAIHQILSTELCNNNPVIYQSAERKMYCHGCTYGRTA